MGTTGRLMSWRARHEPASLSSMISHRLSCRAMGGSSGRRSSGGSTASRSSRHRAVSAGPGGGAVAAVPAGDGCPHQVRVGNGGVRGTCIGPCSRGATWRHNLPGFRRLIAITPKGCVLSDGLPTYTMGYDSTFKNTIAFRLSLPLPGWGGVSAQITARITNRSSPAQEILRGTPEMLRSSPGPWSFVLLYFLFLRGYLMSVWAWEQYPCEADGDLKRA